MARSIFAVSNALLSLVSVVLAANYTSSSVKPISYPPSAYWDGNDGPWSSFFINVGTPSQTLRVLPITDQSTSWVVVPEGCIASYGSTCPDDRGKLFLTNQSSTFENQGIYSLDIAFTDGYLGYSGNAQYGYDTLQLGIPGDGLPTMQSQVLGGIATPGFWLGGLALSPVPVNFTDLGNSRQSLLHDLKNQSKIASSSWAYTAGGYGSPTQIYGSLTLGGYDASQFKDTGSNLTFPFGPDVSKDLLLAIQSITTNASTTPLMSSGNGFYFLDTATPYLWLPTSVCQQFEKTFGLTYDNTSQLYLVNDTLHSQLLQTNPTVTFKLGPQLTGANVEITMPYWAFDLTAKVPLVKNTTRYFPLKQAQNSTQYVLGRAFWQAAYVIADYDRSNFSVHQAAYPAQGTQQQLLSILAPVNQTSSGNGSSGGNSSLSGGAIAGIVIGIVAVVAILGLAFFLVYRRRQRKAAENADPFTKHELDAGQDGATAGARPKDPGAEMEAGDNTKHEMADDGPHKIAELHDPGEAAKRSELETPRETPVYEMPAGDYMSLPELDSAHATPAPRDEKHEPPAVVVSSPT